MSSLSHGEAGVEVQEALGSDMRALIARLKSLGLILKAPGAVSVGWSELHSGKCS